MNQPQWLTPEHYQAMRRDCGHPPERKHQRYRTDGTTKAGIKCLDCTNERERAKPKKPRPKKDKPMGGAVFMFGEEGAAPPPKEVIAQALCGGDLRFIRDPKTLSDEDRTELDRWCGNCPVRQGCLEWAKSERHFIGVAGGHAFGYRGRGSTRREVTPLTGYASRQDQDLTRAG